jgi:hypothetical protein
VSESGLAADIERRIFVVGAPRSGTTLVQSLLAAHGAMTSFTEGHLFAAHFRLLPGSSSAVLLRDPAPRLRAFLAENDEKPSESAVQLAAGNRSGERLRPLLALRTSSIARQLLRVLDELALRRGRTGWIEKTPRHLSYVPFLERLAGTGSGLRFVHVVRDGLEVVASLHRASQSWERSYDLESCVQRWNSDVAFSLRRVGSPRDRFVLYEELVAAPEETLERLCGGLGLDWQPEILERYAEVAGRLVTHREEGWKRNFGRPIRPSAVVEEALTETQRRWARRALRQSLYDRLRRRTVEAASM